MITEKMTITEALAELKTLDARINKLIRDGKYVITINTVSSPVTPEDAAEAIKATYQKVTDLIDRRNAMKMAVVLSNATTKVTISGKEYTVAEAIDAKAHAMVHKATLMDEIARQTNTQHANYERAVKSVEDSAVKMVESAGASSKTTDPTSTEIYKTYMESHNIVYVDPLKVQELLTKMVDEIDEFRLHVDTALSMSNARTDIEFSYGK